MKLLEKYYTNSNIYQGLYILVFRIKLISFSWFTDCGDWFVYITLGKRWYRFSSAGFMKGKHKTQ